MKKTKILASVLAVAIALLLLPVNVLEVSAAEPTTYAVKYIDSRDEWCYQADTSEFKEDQFYSSLFYLPDHLKDGDIVVVYNDTPNYVPELKLGNKKLANLTIASTASFVTVYTGGIDLFFALPDTTSSINGNVNIASVYDDAICNFNNNVGTLNFYIDGAINSSIGCAGTVGHLYGYSADEDRVYYNFYSFKAGSLLICDGGLQTPEANFSRTAPVQQPTATAKPSTSTSTGSSSGEYDDVPKTGESNLAMWLFMAGAAFACVSFLTKKEA